MQLGGKVVEANPHVAGVLVIEARNELSLDRADEGRKVDTIGRLRAAEELPVVRVVRRAQLF